jgi:hypothetical protein
MVYIYIGAARHHALLSCCKQSHMASETRGRAANQIIPSQLRILGFPSFVFPAPLIYFVSPFSSSFAVARKNERENMTSCVCLSALKSVTRLKEEEETIN